MKMGGQKPGLKMGSFLLIQESWNFCLLPNFNVERHNNMEMFYFYSLVA